MVVAPTDEERALAHTLLGRLAPYPLGATPQARLDRIREAVTALALVGARHHTPLGHLAGDCATALAPLIRRHHSPSTEGLHDAEAALRDLYDALTALYGQPTPPVTTGP
ncbi:hypothetical protein LG634_19495 [Streptomyces bambusae]|uniref:hypothetical protein n=1 Tax=Streptomyces bambusae TaxID=1550616 RepID=UPI001CFC9FB6|nr:hypothetical protein [Streptomyces bambusae]MCB5167014.1 hypothetical protein [Streptomyces bambusae]